MRTCEIEGCEAQHKAKGLCEHHYSQIQRKQWEKDHKEHRVKYMSQFRQDNKDYLLGYQKQYYQDNKEHRLKWAKQYRQTPAGKLSRKTNHHNRRIALKGLTLAIVQRVYEDNIKQFGTLTCVLCGKPVEFKDSSLEHLTPITREGTNDYDNLGVAHLICNIKKGTKTLEEWYVRGRS